MADRIDGYASAIFEFADAEGAAARVQSELFAIANAIESNPDLRSALTDPSLPSDRKQRVLDDMLGGRASQVTVNLVGFIASQNRIDDLSEITRRLASREASSHGAKLAEVRSAIPLDESTVQRLKVALAKQVGGPVEVRTVVDPEILGGIVTRVGDVVIDGSVRRSLQSLRQTLQKT